MSESDIVDIVVQDPLIREVQVVVPNTASYSEFFLMQLSVSFYQLQCKFVFNFLK